MLGQPAPRGADLTGESYAFEKALKKSVGGFADVWMYGFFASEYNQAKGDQSRLPPAARVP